MWQYVWATVKVCWLVAVSCWCWEVYGRRVYLRLRYGVRPTGGEEVANGREGAWRV